MNDGEASRVFVGDDAEILNTPSWVDVQIKQIRLKYNLPLKISIYQNKHFFVLLLILTHYSFIFLLIIPLSNQSLLLPIELMLEEPQQQ